MKNIGLGKDKDTSVTFNQVISSLTATPIPRTLEQSLMGIRETSRIETPPENRLETLTHVGNIDESTIALAIQREISRGGKSFVLNQQELQVWMKKFRRCFHQTTNYYMDSCRLILNKQCRMYGIKRLMFYLLQPLLKLV